MTTGPAVVKFEDWPALDQELWRKGQVSDPDAPVQPYALRKRRATLRNAARGWGRLLAILRDHGLLDPNVMPADRLTRPVADLVLRVMHESGNTNNTIKARFWEFRSALKVMQPQVNTTWLTRPGLLSLHKLLPTTLKKHKLLGVKSLYQFGVSMMRSADERPTLHSSHVRLRNGLIVCLFASRAPRIAALVAMRVNIEVKLTEKDCWLLLGSEIEKDHTPLEYPVPPELVPYIRHYLTITRPALLNGGTHDAMWVGSQGQPLTLAAIASMIGRLSSAELGGRFGAHQFRRELATGLAEAEPHNPGLAAAILGIGIEVAEKHYIVARDHEAGRHVADHLAAERERTRLLAERLFRDRR